MSENGQNLKEMPEAEINKRIVNLTISIGQAEVDKKADASAHNDHIKDLTASRQELVDEVLRRKNQA